MTLCPKLILEGTRLTHKTDLAFTLNEHPRIVGPRKYRYHSPVVSAEWCGFTNVPWGRGLVNFDAAEEAQALDTYATWARMFELQRYYSWIVDRFHVSTIVWQKRLKVSGKPSQYDDLGEFVAEQQALRAVVAKSLLPVLEIDISDDDVNGAADRVADWLEATGGLTAPWGV